MQRVEVVDWGEATWMSMGDVRIERGRADTLRPGADTLRPGAVIGGAAVRSDGAPLIEITHHCLGSDWVMVHREAGYRTTLLHVSSALHDLPSAEDQPSAPLLVRVLPGPVLQISLEQLDGILPPIEMPMVAEAGGYAVRFDSDRLRLRGHITLTEEVAVVTLTEGWLYRADAYGGGVRVPLTDQLPVSLILPRAS